MSPDQPDLAASRPRPGQEALGGAASQYTPGSAPSSSGPTEDRRSRQPTPSGPASQLPTHAEEDQASHGRRPSPPLPQHQAQSSHHNQHHQRHQQQQQPPPPVQRGSAAPLDGRGPHPHQARDIVRLFQCRQCSTPYKDAVTLPCGRSICRLCLPATHIRTSITYPALPNRLQAFQCPFQECGKEHVLDDCGVDVVLNKVASIVRAEMERRAAQAVELSQSTSISVRDAWDVAGIGSLVDRDTRPRIVRGTRLVATWTLAADGGLGFEAEVAYLGFASPPLRGSDGDPDAQSLGMLQEVMRSEVDCQVCYAILYDPLTTGCGHTFCRPCLHRILDHSRYCPVCRRKLAINPLLKRSACPSNERIGKIMETFWKDELVTRHEAVAAERAARHQDLDIPLFVCTLSFPMMPTFLHIFEPRYRLMIRRALEGDRTFGMVLPRRPRHGGDSHFHELGTLLRIVNAQFYPDGRSLIETVGLSRFRVVRHGQLDGYTVGKTERIDDVSLEEEEAMEAAEVGYDAGDSAAGHRDARDGTDDPGEATDAAKMDDDARGDAHGDAHGDAQQHPERSDSPSSMQAQFGRDIPQSAHDLDAMTTQNLMRFTTGFVTRMRDQSVPWLTERMLAIYGDCPDDPAIFPWWLASTLPVKDLEKYKLLGTSSVRDRLKICGSWIMQMETVRWSLHDCTIL